ncbi:MAG: hypothetical protein KKE62_10405 [Proteobacteria bacterium]|nr:hypothetical protein [Pseudomonadota bacterium]MBU1387861.1 hypothetical protein [Pseudomonadota bacterium]MBU1543238.1 hypothetical protein [Pseudomonadota bacterium]MBU2482471.1 hypothetical protein [Pseudomonadota bacterium]
MKIARFLSLVLAVSLFLITPINGFCGLVLIEGESYTFEFASLPYNSEYSQDFVVFSYLQLSSTPSANTLFQFSVYEDSILDLPIRSETNVRSFGYLESSDATSWQDFQGVFEVEVILGMIEIEYFMASTIIGNSLYRQNFAVPIPSSCTSLIIGILLVGSIGFYNKKHFSE